MAEYKGYGVILATLSNDKTLECETELRVEACVNRYGEIDTLDETMEVINPYNFEIYDDIDLEENVYITVFKIVDIDYTRWELEENEPDYDQMYDDWKWYISH